MYNLISKLNIFYTEDENIFKLNNKLLDNIEIYLNILNLLKTILLNKMSDAHIYCKKQNLIMIIERDNKISVLDFIDFINSQENGVWLIDNKSYKFNQEFKDKYDDDFVKLVKTIIIQLKDIHKILISRYIEKRKDK